ncbi:hypothetical protein GGX14DRAFT_309528, partial [Mycena pura]
TVFESIRAEQTARGVSQFSPFRDEDDWDLAHWLAKNVNQGAADEYLKLNITRQRTKPSYHNNYAFLKKVDQLETGPGWKCERITVEGDCLDEEGEVMTEELDLWKRDPVECVQELIGNPAFKDHIAYVPERVY